MNSASDILADKKNCDICCVSPQQTISEAVKLMADHRIGAILVKDGRWFWLVSFPKGILCATARMKNLTRLQQKLPTT